MSPIAPQDVTGLVLAGGLGTRMGGADKGLQVFDGLPLALHALRRLRLQVGGVALNANRNRAVYESFGAPVWSDDLPDHPGPLAGFLAGLDRCGTPFLLAVPCDTPLFPSDLAERLARSLVAHDAELAVAAAPQADRHGVVSLRPQPACCLLRTGLRESLRRFVAGGGRKIDAWTAGHRRVVVPFDRPGDDPDAFRNANTFDELDALRGRGASVAEGPARASDPPRP
ncbi:MAG TPA: molybdenum cofactor guanylyltransferase MobA [Variovorax sp.]|nr:molybdenum cofactor guanylyltransferase MobA [Variovorax sp.]